MNSLLPPSSSAWLRSAEAGTARLSGITVAIRTLWTPTTCPVDLLPYLAWALSVDRWDKSWPAEKKIASIQQSYWIHRRKGTVAAVRRVIENLGFSMEIKEWWETGSRPGTFSLTVGVNDIGLSDGMGKELERLIGDARPVSRHINSLSISISAAGNIYSGASASCDEVIDVYPLGYTPDDSIYYDGVNFHIGNANYTESKERNGMHLYDGKEFHDGSSVYTE
ncbi:tail protein [Pluralibacter gergoviae]|uniref:phage tail protein I n=1 Tax=Pluralibacter gergoviae TaxID=61647 RepID=UPI00065032C8|nr:phage tail protein I [Pluralibacter gergoviae]KMK28645.1 tail protein [Pluralibacter gergoviae]